MRTINDLTYEERKEYSEMFSVWLAPYVHSVIVKVMANAEEIINNETAMHMLRELKERTDKEVTDFTNSIDYLLQDYEEFKEFDPHNHCLTHADSYRDILYDMYIR